MELFFDTETSGLFNFKKPNHKAPDFPWVVQLGAILAEDGIAYAEYNVIIQPDGRDISEGAAKVHNIPLELAERTGLTELSVAKTFIELADHADVLVAHNMDFDWRLMMGMLYRCSVNNESLRMTNKYCTMKNTTRLCKLPGPYGQKWPKLQELHNHLFGVDFVGAHDAMFDIKATMKCYYELKKIGWI